MYSGRPKALPLSIPLRWTQIPLWDRVIVDRHYLPVRHGKEPSMPYRIFYSLILGLSVAASAAQAQVVYPYPAPYAYPQPYSGSPFSTLSGAADVLRAQGGLLLMQEQARLLRE